MLREAASSALLQRCSAPVLQFGDPRRRTQPHDPSHPLHVPTRPLLLLGLHISPRGQCSSSPRPVHQSSPALECLARSVRQAKEQHIRPVVSISNRLWIPRVSPPSRINPASMLASSVHLALISGTQKTQIGSVFLE